MPINTIWTREGRNERELVDPGHGTGSDVMNEKRNHHTNATKRVNSLCVREILALSFTSMLQYVHGSWKSANFYVILKLKQYFSIRCVVVIKCCNYSLCESIQVPNDVSHILSIQ